MIMRPWWSEQMKLVMVLDLIFFNTLLILAICLLDKNMNFVILSKLIEIIICYLKDFLVVMLILSFTLLGLLMVLWISFIFSKERLRKFFSIFKISLMLEVEQVTCTYDCLSLLLLEMSAWFLFLFWKNFDFLRTSLLGLDRIEGKIWEISAFLLDLSIIFFLSDLLLIFFRVNLEAIFYQNILLWFLVFKESYPAL